MAGNDVLDLPDDIEKCINEIKRYINEGKLPESRIEESVKKVLRAKYRLGLNNYKPINEANIRAELNTPKAYTLKRQLIQNAMTLVSNPNDLIPFKDL